MTALYNEETFDVLEKLSEKPIALQELKKMASGRKLQAMWRADLIILKKLSRGIIMVHISKNGRSLTTRG
tara:strand:- start:279 stop:488 length:210 start_codon:yes stop_codon:yes gene_type:complete